MPLHITNATKNITKESETYMAPRKRTRTLTHLNELFFEHGTDANIIHNVMKHNGYAEETYQVFNTFTTDDGSVKTRVLVTTPVENKLTLIIPDEHYVWLTSQSN